MDFLSDGFINYSIMRKLIVPIVVYSCIHLNGTDNCKHELVDDNSPFGPFGIDEERSKISIEHTDHNWDTNQKYIEIPSVLKYSDLKRVVWDSYSGCEEDDVIHVHIQFDYVFVLSIGISSQPANKSFERKSCNHCISHNNFIISSQTVRYF